MCSKAIVKVLFDVALNSTKHPLARVPAIKELIFNYFYPEIIFEDQDIFHDICILWITGKGFDRTHVRLSENKYCDGHEREKFKSKFVQDLFDEFTLTYDPDALTFQGTSIFDARFKFVTTHLKQYLTMPIIFGTGISMEAIQHTGSMFEDTNSPYPFSSERDRGLEQRQLIRSEDGGVTALEQWREIIATNIHVLPLLLRSNLVRVAAHLYQQSFSTQDVLCACRLLQFGQMEVGLSRMAGVGLSREFVVGGMNMLGDPILVIFFEERRHYFTD